MLFESFEIIIFKNFSLHFILRKFYFQIDKKYLELAQQIQESGSLYQSLHEYATPTKQ